MKKEFLTFPRSAKLYLVSQFLLSGYYTWPFWYGFASGRITASQFGIYLAIVYIVGLISEVPTGAFADRYGRKLSAVIGAVGGAVMPLVVFFGSNFTAYVVAGIVAGISSAFVSGSLESLIRDLPSMTKEMYRRIMIQDTFFYQSGLIISSAIGGFMYTLSHPLPFVAQAVSFAVAAIVIMQISPEGEVAQNKAIVETSRRTRLKEYLSSTKEGFLHLFKAQIIRPLIVFGCTLSVLMWLSIEYINEAAMIHYDIQPEFRGLLIAGTKVVALLILNGIVVKKIKTDEQKLLYLLLMTLGVFSLYSLGIKSIFLLAFLGFNLVSSINSNFIKPILHDHIESKWRATSISAYSFVSNLAQAIASVGVGFMLQKQGVLFVQRAFLVLFILVAVPSLIAYLSRTKLNYSSKH